MMVEAFEDGAAGLTGNTITIQSGAAARTAEQ